MIEELRGLIGGVPGFRFRCVMSYIAVRESIIASSRGGGGKPIPYRNQASRILRTLMGVFSKLVAAAARVGGLALEKGAPMVMVR